MTRVDSEAAKALLGRDEWQGTMTGVSVTDEGLMVEIEFREGIFGHLCFDAAETDRIFHALLERVAGQVADRQAGNEGAGDGDDGHDKR